MKNKRLITILIGWCFICCIGNISTNAAEQKSIQPRYIRAIKDSYAIAWNPKGNVLAIGTNDAIYLANDNLGIIQQLSNPVQLIEGIAWSPDGRYLAASSMENTWPQSKVRIWDTQTRKIVNVFEGHKYAIPTLAWSPDGHYIATGSWDQTLKIWDPFTGVIARTFSYKPDDLTRTVEQVSWSLGSDRVAANIAYSGILIWDINTGDLNLHISDPRISDPGTNGAAWSPDGKKLFDGYRFLNPNTGEVVSQYNCFYSDVVAWHPDSLYLAGYAYTSPTDPPLLTVCNTVTGAFVAQLDSGVNFNEAGTYVNALSWNPDGKRLAGAAGDGFVRIWDVPLPSP